MYDLFQCENCGQQKCQCGVFLDTKNVGKYPNEVSHSWLEKRLKLCADCTTAIHKCLRDRIKLQQGEDGIPPTGFDKDGNLQTLREGQE